MERLTGSDGLDRIGKTVAGQSGTIRDGTRSIAVMSGKGGVGKTTTTLNLGAAIADTGTETAILDMDLDTANLPIELGYITAGSTTIQELLDADEDPDVLAAVNRVRERLGILPATVEKQDISWSAAELEELIVDLDRFVLIDTPPGITEHQYNIMRAVDGIIITMTPSESAFIDGTKMISLAEQAGTEVVGVVINRAGESRYDLSVDEIRDALGDTDVLAVVPEDGRVKKMKRAGEPLTDIHPHAPAAIAYNRLAAELTGTDYTPPNALQRAIGRVKR